MDWNALALVAVGGLIGIAGSFFNNWFQANERQKDRDEARRDAKVQAREKWIERDILKIMDLLETTMGLLAKAENVDLKLSNDLSKTKTGWITTEDALAHGDAILLEALDRVFEIGNTIGEMARLVYSFAEDEIISSYIEFEQAIEAWMPTVEEKSKEEKEANWTSIISCAGQFQQALREKLISIRNT